jgi:L-fuconolactonase
MFVDSHQHFWSVARGDYGWLTPEAGAIYRDFLPGDLELHLKHHGIARTVLVQAAPSVAETDYLLKLADETPWVGAVVGWIDFEDRTHRHHLERWAQNPKFRGVRPMIQDIPDEAWILKPSFEWAFLALAELDLHFEFLGFPQHVDVARRLLLRHPRLPVVVDHGMKPQIRAQKFEPWASEIAILARETAALCKLSALVTEALPGWTLLDLKPYVDHIITAFGPERVMWGSDWPVVNLNGNYDAWRAVTLALVGAHPGAAAILGRTAERFYRLDSRN